MHKVIFACVHNRRQRKERELNPAFDLSGIHAAFLEDHDTGSICKPASGKRVHKDPFHGWWNNRLEQTESPLTTS